MPENYEMVTILPMGDVANSEITPRFVLADQFPGNLGDAALQGNLLFLGDHSACLVDIA